MPLKMQQPINLRPARIEPLRKLYFGETFSRFQKFEALAQFLCKFIDFHVHSPSVPDSIIFIVFVKLQLINDVFALNDHLPPVSFGVGIESLVGIKANRTGHTLKKWNVTF